MNKYTKRIKLISIKKNNRNIKYRSLELFDSCLTLHTISKIETFIEEVGSFPNLYINLKSMKLNQKLPINILEWLFYDLLIKKNKNIILDYSFSRTIYTEGFRSSPLIFLGKGRYYDKEKFISTFKFSSNRKESKGISHYRRLIPFKSDISYLSILNSDIDNTFPVFVPTDTKDQVTLLITELVGNALEHAQADCIMDLDITSNNFTYDKSRKEKQGKQYFAINVSILNHSSMLLFSEIKNKVLNHLNEVRGRNKIRYDFINTSYTAHKDFFDKAYSEDNFWTLATIQHKISGRPFSSTGGTGLTTLVNALQQASELDKCYILTGTDILFLKKEYLSHTEDMWLGFNQTNNFNKTPDKSIFEKSPLTFNGTAFNLSFIMED